MIPASSSKPCPKLLGETQLLNHPPMPVAYGYVNVQKMASDRAIEKNIELASARLNEALADATGYYLRGARDYLGSGLMGSVLRLAPWVEGGPKALARNAKSQEVLDVVGRPVAKLTNSDDEAFIADYLAEDLRRRLYNEPAMRPFPAMLPRIHTVVADTGCSVPTYCIVREELSSISENVSGNANVIDLEKTDAKLWRDFAADHIRRMGEGLDDTTLDALDGRAGASIGSALSLILNEVDFGARQKRKGGMTATMFNRHEHIATLKQAYEACQAIIDTGNVPDSRNPADGVAYFLSMFARAAQEDLGVEGWQVVQRDWLALIMRLLQRIAVDAIDLLLWLDVHGIAFYDLNPSNFGFVGPYESDSPRPRLVIRDFGVARIWGGRKLSMSPDTLAGFSERRRR